METRTSASTIDGSQQEEIIGFNFVMIAFLMAFLPLSVASLTRSEKIVLKVFSSDSMSKRQRPMHSNEEVEGKEEHCEERIGNVKFMLEKEIMFLNFG
tara:strand:+ start:446 stop:739 length:294 start_codon:yes stop_codon:yes gene_type:complete